MNYAQMQIVLIFSLIGAILAGSAVPRLVDDERVRILFWGLLYVALVGIWWWAAGQGAFR